MCIARNAMEVLKHCIHSERHIRTHDDVQQITQELSIVQKFPQSDDSRLTLSQMMSVAHI